MIKQLLSQQIVAFSNLIYFIQYAILIHDIVFHKTPRSSVS